MKKILLSGAFMMALVAITSAPAIAQDKPAKDRKAIDKADDSAKGVVYELTIDGMS